MSTIFIFALAAVNVPFIVHNPASWANWTALVFCFGLGIADAISNR